ncbi:MAG TPA: hypothetical protein VHZ07_12135 [Bryobacteraceae bacterium]|jgi:hypothetical protein|nr:hypothetical protein [Bryobacteraceae bacterium]
MRILLFFVCAVLGAAQSPVAQLINVSRPGKTGYQIGDRFRIVITGQRNQPISVRTTILGRTDWGPVIAQTDDGGQWSTTGQFEKSDFGDWSEAWTVGGKLASPVTGFSVGAPCLPGGQHSVAYLGAPRVETCETKEGTQSFGTPSYGDPFRTPDGRMIPGRTRSNMTAEQYHMGILESLILNWQSGLSPGFYGDEAAAHIVNLIGVNALSEREMQNAVLLIHAAFEKPNRIPQTARDPTATLSLLRNFANAAQEAGLKQQIAETINYVQLQ